VAYWAAAQLVPAREMLALHFLAQAGFETYAPRLRERRTVKGRKVVKTPLLFPAYAFVFIRLQWHAARWAPGVMRLVMDGTAPARVPDAVIADIRAREVRGLVELPKAPPAQFGDAMRVLRGPFAGRVGIPAQWRHSWFNPSHLQVSQFSSDILVVKGARRLPIK
jgi:transcriptional antiterminator RfaH